jgi:hypothetical protein
MEEVHRAHQYHQDTHQTHASQPAEICFMPFHLLHLQVAHGYRNLPKDAGAQVVSSTYILSNAETVFRNRLSRHVTCARTLW